MNKLYIMIKNYLKLIFRNKVMIIVVPIATILVVAALANAFHTLLDSAEDISEIRMGYEMPADSKYAMLEKMMVKLEKKKILFLVEKNKDWLLQELFLKIQLFYYWMKLLLL